MENIRISVLQMPVHQLVHHPDNPRKEFGDLSELTESIRKKGIMQNLTIIPVECRELPVEQQPNINEINMNGEFLVLIGNRRMEAAKQAGVEKLPCRIVTGLSKKDQIAVMLEENMQRNDLSISEQANSFQLMLNLGDTVDGIQEKTGFSKSTIYHRLNIAKLDPETVEEKVKDESFQLSFGDMYALEKIESVEKRNEVLKNATDSKNLRWRAERAVKEELSVKNRQILKEVFKRLKLKKAPKGAQPWSCEWDEKLRIDTEEDDIQPKIEKLEKMEETDEMVWGESYSRIYILKQVKKVKRELSQYEIKQKEREKNRKKIREIYKTLCANTKDAIDLIIKGEFGKPDQVEQLWEKLWKMMLEMSASGRYSIIARFLSKDPNFWNLEKEESERWNQEAKTLPMLDQMLVCLHDRMTDLDPVDYRGRINESAIKPVRAFLELLQEEYGYTISDTEQSVLDGSSPLFAKEDDNA